MKEDKTISLNEIFLIVITAASFLMGNAVLATSGKYACLSEVCVTTSFPASNNSSHVFI